MGVNDSSSIGDSAVATLRLRLTHSHGRASNGTRLIASIGTGMASALELGGERLNETQWRAAELCRIAQTGQGWQLLNGNPALVCALNGERVVTHVPMVVAAGDTLELGLLRFVLEGGGTAMAQAAPPELTGALWARPTANIGLRVDSVKAGEAADDLFDLRDLATASRPVQSTDQSSDQSSDQSTHQSTPVTQSSHLDDLFGVLDIAGAERRTVGDPLAELLGELPPPSATSAASYADSRNAPQHEAEPVRQAHADLTHSLLTDLHEEFVRVVRDPTQLTGRSDWDSVASSGYAPPPTLDELSQLSETHHLVRHILQPPEGIDQTIADFDLINPSTLLDTTEIEDVLRLFAPTLALGAKAAVPSLTRREHHDLSPDSHMDLGAFRPDDKENR